MHLRLIDDCHLVAHAIGKAVWQRYAEHHPTSTIADLRRAAATLVPLCPSETCTDGIANQGEATPRNPRHLDTLKGGRKKCTMIQSEREIWR